MSDDELPTWAEDEVIQIIEQEIIQNAFPDGVDDLKRLVLDGIRRALAKAVEAADEGVCAEDCPHVACVEARTVREAIRALGAAK